MWPSALGVLQSEEDNLGRITDNVRGTWAIRGGWRCRRWELGEWVCYGAVVAEPLSVFGVVNGAGGNVSYANVPLVLAANTASSCERSGYHRGAENSEKS